MGDPELHMGPIPGKDHIYSQLDTRSYGKILARHLTIANANEPVNFVFIFLYLIIL